MDPLSPEMGGDSLLLEDFGQKVDLTRRIREVLLNYPEGTTVLKELIQNADDAGATKVCLCLDRRFHGSESLISSKLAQWQGPALLAYNNAVFTEDDFVSISRIGGSTKQGQAWKTGRFGVGFNSVYHITDLPSFVSGKYVVLFDPQGVYLPNISMANPGKRIDFVNSSALSSCRDQFLPYCTFGCNMKVPFAGTLFRFPLRNKDQASNSKLSKQVYSEEDISSIFDKLFEEGVLTLLFLKSVLSVEMYVWDVGVPEPRKIYSWSINSANDNTVCHRQALLRLSSINLPEPVTDAFLLEFLSEAVLESHSQKRTDTFYIVQTMASETSRIGSFAAAASKNYDIRLLPWASVAACISDDISDNGILKIGRAFCFLPLPVQTGMTVQVNGYFEVSSNRRGIWYGADMDRSGKIRSTWNRLLLEDIVAPTYIKLLVGVQQLLGPTKFYYSLWPSGSFEEPWNILVEHIYHKIGDAPVLYSELNGGKWVSPMEAFLHDVEFSKSRELGEALLQLGMPVVHVPKALSDILLKYGNSFSRKVVTPDSVRHFLREHQSISTISRLFNLVLLEYCLEDLLDSDVSEQAYDLPLLPLANGDLGGISEASKGICYFICNELEYKLLEQISDRIIDHHIPPNLFSRLSAIARASNTNITVFNVHYLHKIFTEFVPADWKYKSKVLWDPSSDCSHPTFSWFVLFWQYLRDCCEKLSLFSEWPILPSLSGHLYRPLLQSKLLDVERLSEKMQSILAKIGCKILNRNYSVGHPELCCYVSNADAAGVLKAIFDVAFVDNSMTQTFHYVEADERDELRGFLLDPNWYMGNQMVNSDICNCKRLPIYKVYSGESPQTVWYSDLDNNKKFLPPFNVPKCFLGTDFIYTSSNNEAEVLNRYYGIERMRKTTFYKQHVLHRVKELEAEVRDNIMLSILQELPQLCVEDALFKECLRNLDFVPTSNGSLKSPMELYDPRNEELFALLEDSDKFPSCAFQGSGILDILQGLGLGTTVSFETILQSARQVEQLMHVNQQRAYSRGKVVLSYLEVNAMKWLPAQPNEDQGTVNRMLSRAATAFRPHHLKSNTDKSWNDLRMISWCPVLVSPPYQSLPWPAVSSVVAPPKLVRLHSDLWLVSGSMRILDGECSSTALSKQFGWSLPPAGNVIAAQLLELGKNNEIVTDQVLRQELALAMPRIYTILMGMVGSEEMDVVKAVLEGCRWIWVGDGFATSDEVVLNGPLHLAPYIRVIPVDLAAFRDLFLELGIQEFLKPSDYADILCRMAIRKGSTPLDAQEIRAAILIAQHLAEAHFYEQQIKIYLPDVSGRLVSATDLVYNDAPWLLGSEEPGDLFGNSSTVTMSAKRSAQKFVHGNISNDVAEKLGVHSLRRMLLAESADSMNLSLSGAAEAFGQHEALTTRLKHILEMYADGPGILFELVQNAEDAKASKIFFLLDKTHYGTSSVLSPEMADWQGPALYCYNDSVFSPQDLYAISRIGQESKLDKPFAIGRFGLGFNSVYHFTDIPAFVSGENIVIFDPHACNLPGISPSHPGLRIKFVGRTILEQFPDQFSPFLHFGCDLQQPFPGTLFRFPLRSGSVASQSQIKKESYEPEDVISLFLSFSKVVSETLLFLGNVKTISIFVKEGAKNEMQLLHRVDKYCFTDPQAESNEFHRLFDLMQGNQQDGLDKDQFLNKLSKSVDTVLPWKCQKIVVREQNLYEEKLHLWMTSECLGSGCLNNALASFDIKSHKLTPWACVASYLHTVKVDKEFGNDFNAEETSNITPDIIQVPISIKDRKNFEGRAFCFLPLPINTELPVHINAYFELSSNRRDIWFGNDMAGGGKKRSDWNIYLLEDVVAPAYGHFLEKVALETGPSDLYFSFWPTVVTLEPWASMVRKLYLFIADFGLCVLYTKARGGLWISTKQAIYPDFTFDRAHELVEALSDAGLPVVDVPERIVDKFMEFCPFLHFLTPQFLRTLLIRRNRGFRDRQSMILTLDYCLRDIRVPVQCDNLFGLPLLPLSNGLFTTFEKRGMSERVYVACGDEYDLLKDSIPHQLVDCGISDALYKKLCDLAQSGDFNISLLTCDLLEKLFPRLLPPEWQHAKQVTWTHGVQGQPSLEWMRLLWSYLKSSCDDLSVFSRWPILPVGNNCLLQLVENSNVIEDNGWSENLSSLLLRVGCLILRSDLVIEHAQLKNYVQSPDATGLLNVLLAVAGNLENIEDLFRDAAESELHELRSFILQTKWFSEGSMDDMHIDIIKQLPIFESFRSRKLVCLSKPAKLLKPIDVREDLLDDNFVRTESDREIIILKTYLKIREPSRAEFYKDYVLNRMPEFILHHEALLTILQDVKLLIEEDNTLRTALSSTAFVLACDGTCKQPSRLYDPRIPELQKLLCKEVFFPSEKFSDPETLEILINLGLKKTLGLTGLLDCARSVSMLHDLKKKEAIDYGRRLLACLDATSFRLSAQDDPGNYDEFRTNSESPKNSVPDGEVEKYSQDRSEDCLEAGLDLGQLLGNFIDNMPGEEFWLELKAIAWCPVYAYPPIPGLPWLAANHQVAAPMNVRPRSQMWLVSSRMSILDGECQSAYLQHKLGWMDLPSVDVLSTQLICLSESYTELKLQSTGDPDIDAVLQKELPLLYSKLQEYVGTDEFLVLKSALNGVSWVWIGDDFVSPSVLAFDSPVKFSPYLYVLPSELSEFRDLLLALGARLSFDVRDYLHVLECLRMDLKGSALSSDQLGFVNCVLEAIAEWYSENPLFDLSNTPLIIPDSSGILKGAADLVYNDAPWMENTLVGKHFVHPCISNDLANKLGVQSLRCLSLVSEEMTKDLPCMDHAKICELLELYGNCEVLLFDLLELADCCKAKKCHLIFDKREHPCQSLLQHNLGEFQGPAVLAILEGVSLSREELSNLQFLPPWRMRGDTLNYGLGMLSCFYICDLLSVVSGGYFYMFDPRGLAFAMQSGCAPAAKMFSLTGTNLTEQFRDQFNPLLIGQSMPWSSSDSTIIRMPLSSECIKDGVESGMKRIEQIFEKFMDHGSKTLLFLKSVLQVTLSTWEPGSLQLCQHFSIYVDPLHAIMRNPFSERKWRKFQISRLFSSSNAAIKLNVIDVTLYQGGTRYVDRWLVVLTLGSGQTRNMALDRRYLAYNLMPIAGVAAHVCRDDKPAEAYWSSSLMCPLPLSAGLNIPVTILGCFLVRHNQGRYLFRYQNVESLLDAQCDAVNQLIEAWNRELMSCVCDSYIEIVLEMQKLRTQPSTSALGSGLDHNFIVGLNAYDNHYSFWPRSSRNIQINQSDDGDMFSSNVLKADWQCVIDQVIRPFYVRVIDLPVWQLYSGNLVKAEEGMFLSKPETGVGANMLPDTVCAFVKEQYPVFSVPWELMTEIQAVGVMVRQIKPKMVRSLLKISSTSIVLRCIDTFADVLEYCLSDIHIDKPSNPSTSEELAETIYSDYPPHKDDVSSSSSAPITGLHKFSGMSDQRSASSGGDALEVVASLGRALFDFGRGVVGDIGRTGGPLVQRNTAMGSGSDDIRRNWDQELLLVAAELKGLPCPTAGNRLVKLGFTEVWVGNKEQQVLMTSLAAKFVHLKLMDRPILANIFLSRSLQALLKLQSFSLHLLAENMRLLFHENWVSYVLRSNMAPCFSWENTTSCSAEQGPSPEWIRLFWKCFTGSLEDLSLFADWPLIPAFLGRRVLCRVRQRHLVFIPPPFTDTDSAYTLVETRTQETNMNELLSESECIKAYSDSFEDAKTKYPWLLSFLNQCNIPIFDTAFLDCAAQCNCFPTPGSSLGQVIACKLAAAKYAGYIPELNSLSAADCDELLSLLSSDFTLNRSRYGREELEVLRDLPVFRTVVGSYTRLHDQELCLISSNSFLKPYHEHCLSYSTNSSESSLLQALGVPVLHDEQIFVRFGLPGFEGKPQSEQEDVLIYLYENWQDFQHDSSVTEALRETNFVRNAEEFSIKLSKPKDLFDPGDVLLTSIFSAEREKFPGERFSTDGWLRILRKTGLRTAAEPDVILDCARKVESLVSECTKSGEAIDDFDSFNSQNEVPIEIWLLAESVVKAIFSNFAFLYGANFCNILGKIACVPAVKGFPNGGGKRGEKRVLCSFSEAILLKDWPLAWSCAPILSRQCVVPPEYSWGALYLRSPPSFSTVLKHLQVIGRNNGEDTLAHWPTTLGLMTIEEASFEVLKYLDKVWGSLSASDITELQRVAFVPAANGTRLVTANSLFARLTINLSPFAFELPSMYLPFVKILKDMGLQDMLSVACAQDLLLNLQRACGYHRLNPNELRAVVEILHFICEKTNESNMPGKSWELDAIVLDDGCRLVHARSCVYVDSYGSQYIKYIDTSRLRLVNPDIPERICTTLGIKKLSDVVVEELDDAEHLQTMGQIGSVALVAIRQKLSCKSFQTAVWKVVNSVNSGILDFNGLTLEKLQTLLDLVAENLKFVRYLYTRFLLLPKSLDITRVVKESVIPEWEGGSQHRTLYFIDRMKTCMLVAEPPSYISVLDIVAIVVSQVLGCSVHLPIVPLFLCPDGSEIAIVNILKLHSEKGEDRCIGGKNCLLGRELLAQDAIHVQLHPLRPFYSGEFVAWRSQNGDKLKYGRVLEDVRPSAGQALYRLRVEVGLGVTEHLLSSHVFSFKGVLIDNEAFIDTKVKDDHLVNENVIQVDEPEVSGRGKSHSTQGHCQPNKELQYGYVSAAELVQAVHEMLSAAGISMDVEKQSLLQTTFTLHEQLKETQAILLLEQEKSDMAAKEAEIAKAAWLCRVCLTNEVDNTLIPCGHVLCRRCSSAVSRCPFCRLQVSKTMRIFRP